MLRNQGRVRRVNRGLSEESRSTLLLEYWKQSTLVQQHFNDVSMKVRNFAVLVFSGFLTGVGVSLHNDIYVTLLGVKISAAIMFALLGAVVTQLIHFMDTYWYHVFLKSAVSSTLNIERELQKIFNLDTLADGISKGSQSVQIYSFFGHLDLPKGVHNKSFSVLRGRVKGFKKAKLYFLYKNVFLKFFSIFFKKKVVDSSLRHKVFYRWLIGIILFTGVISFYVEPKSGKEKDINFNEVKSFVSGTKVHLRDLPSFEGQIIATLDLAQPITIIKDQNKTWVFVSAKYMGSPKVGFIHRDYILYKNSINKN
ncbi:SH3 domain-containing protein [Pseudoalteromonas gelatinilytica]|uniref:SH3 domain-containing protein n=1 Tax=Pseudoalteromonas gelatinilytica TaxID=1703256 RepID=UPI0007C582E0|nr:SH3 domain-containing protein [Pseudoalteromonas gelatinilytica]